MVRRRADAVVDVIIELVAQTVHDRIRDSQQVALFERLQPESSPPPTPLLLP
jgi:hypothetical protein